MNPKRRQRLLLVIGLVVLAAVAIGLTLYALRSNLNLFYTPKQIAAGQAPVGRTLRAGGVVRFNSVKHSAQGVDVSFVITDFDANVKVDFDGILPDLFREGSGVVVIGKLEPNGVIDASQVLAKHDEKYTPPEVASALKQGGQIPEKYRLQMDAGFSPQAIRGVARVGNLASTANPTQ